MLNAYTQSINKAYSRKGSLFAEHLKRNQVTDDEYLKELIVYIHLNPVKHGFSSSLDYQHSSYRAIISQKPTLLMRNDVLEYFDDVDNFIYWHNFKKMKRKEILALNEDDE